MPAARADAEHDAAPQPKAVAATVARGHQRVAEFRLRDALRALDRHELLRDAVPRPYESRGVIYASFEVGTQSDAAREARAAAASLMPPPRSSGLTGASAASYSPAKTDHDR